MKPEQQAKYDQINGYASAHRLLAEYAFRFCAQALSEFDNCVVPLEGEA